MILNLLCRFDLLSTSVSEVLLVSRRQLLRGRLSAYADECYPPWAVIDTPFTEHCTRCNACLTSCPENIIKHNEAGFPVVDFSDAGCTFCAKCVDSCENNSLSVIAYIGTQPWSLKATINRSCVNFNGGVCRICADSCGESAISIRVSDKATTFTEIDFDRCTGCGQCYRSCPSRAIRITPA